MNVSSFLKSSTTKISPAQFLETHRGFLNQYPILAPILKEYDAGKLLPTPTLMQISTLLVTVSDLKENAAILLPKKKESKAPIQVQAEKKEVKASKKRYAMTLYFAPWKGSVDMLQTEGKPIIKTAKTYGEAERMADLWLFKNEDSLWVEITCTDGVSTRVMRGDSIARLFKQKVGPATRGQIKSSARLGNKMRCKDFQAKFSRG